MRFCEWLLSEEKSGLLFAKSVDQNGVESILKNGFKLQGRQSQVAMQYSKEKSSTDEQMYGPGLYFFLTPSEDYAKKNCKDYSGWGGSIVVASLNYSAKLLITSWLPENSPIWQHAPSGYAGVYDQLSALGVLDQFPEYKKGDTHFEPEWGYKLASRIDGWLHQHNTRTHLVVYNPSVLKLVSHFNCSQEVKRQPETKTEPSPPKVNPRTGKEYETSKSLDRQMLRSPLLSDTLALDSVRRIQQNPNHPDHHYWIRFKLIGK